MGSIAPEARAKLLGLDAPTKLDVSGIYQRGGADIEAEQRAREAVIEALPIEEQRRIPGSTERIAREGLIFDQRNSGSELPPRSISNLGWVGNRKNKTL
jgi:hypothetical protein